MKEEKKGKSGPDAKTAVASAKVAVKENLLAPEIYADGAPWVSSKGGNVMILFTSLRFDNSSIPAVATHVTVGRLVMPAAEAARMASLIQNHLTKQTPAQPEVGSKPN